jgi:hypothetical protein
MLLKPFPTDNEPEESSEVECEVTNLLPPGLSSVLGMAGLQDSDESDEVSENHVQAILKKHNAGLDNVARQLGSLLVSADNDAVKLNAAKTILQLNGLLGRDDDSGNKAPSINITIVGSQNKPLINVLIPSAR